MFAITRLSIPAAAAFLALVSMNASANEPQRFQHAMMDMMPMGNSGTASTAQPRGAMPGMTDDKMPAQGPIPMNGNMPPESSGAGAMAAPGQNQTMRGCGMMEMMQNMMRMGGAQQGMPSMSGGPMTPDSPPSGSSAARLEGRIAFLRTELRVTDTQAPAWDSFVTALRAGREHLDAARAALQDSAANADPLMRLQSFEKHLTERAEAIHTSQMAFSALYAKLDDVQKRVATANMLPFMGAF